MNSQARYLSLQKLKSREKSRKTKLARSLNDALSEEYHKPLSQADTSHIPWGVLATLATNQKKALGELYTDVMSAVSRKDVLQYLEVSQRLSDPLKYDLASSYWGATLVASLLKKYPFEGVVGLDPEKKARERSEVAERRCRIANKRLSYYSKRWYRLKQHDRWLGNVFHNARLKIQQWLGPVNLNEIYDHARHGPGGTLNCPRPFSTAYFKYAQGMAGYSVSARCYPYAEAAILADPLWLRSLVADFYGINPVDVSTTPDLAREIVQRALVGANYNKVTYVPKTAQTHRAIAIEPLMNIFLQLGVGGVLKKRLASAGCDLRSQERNQQLAALGSCDVVPDFERPSTMDLEMASDTLCIELVRELIPEDWFQLLSDLRSPFGLNADGSVRKWAKFSSMGNGYTFELESLIFYALVCSTVEYFGGSLQYVSVFGDDIVVPHYWFPMAREVLQFAGFRTNSAKTFVAGPFRESCGKDFFKGTAVRPFYLKRQIKSRKDLIFLANSLDAFTAFDDSPAYAAARDFVIGRLPQLLRDELLGPRTEDPEGHLFTSYDNAQKATSVKWDRELQCWSFPTFRAKSRVWANSPKISFQYLQYMEGVTCMDGSESSSSSGSRSQVVLSGGSEVRYLDRGLTYLWDNEVERPKLHFPAEYPFKFFTWDSKQGRQSRIWRMQCPSDRAS